MRARGINLILDDLVSTFPEPGVVGVSTNSGKTIADADLVVRLCFVYLPRQC